MMNEIRDKPDINKDKTSDQTMSKIDHSKLVDLTKHKILVPSRAGGKLVDISEGW